MVKIGAELPKLSENKTGGPFFWTTLYIYILLLHKQWKWGGRRYYPQNAL